MFVQLMPNNANPVSQYQQYGASQQFMMQPSPVMYQAPVAPYEQGASFPQCPPGNFACPPGNFTMPQGMFTGSNPQLEHTNHTVKAISQAAPNASCQGDNPLPQKPNGVVFMQMMVPVPVYAHCAMQAPTSMQQVVGPPGSLSSADPRGLSGSACKGSKAKHSGAAARKKLAGSMHPEKVQWLKRALQDTATSHSQPTVPRVQPSQCSTVEGLSDGDANSESQETSRQTSSEATNSDSLTAKQLCETCFAEKVDAALADLDDVYEWKCQNALQWVSESFWTLALDKKGCRVVQKAMDVASPAYLLELLANLEGHVNQAMQSPHANYILQKFIELAPSERLQFVVAELQNDVLYVARHRFGCRILQRLLEHCKPWQTEQLISKALADAAVLCRHQYGNFILQHILQYGSKGQRSAVADVILADIIPLSKHRLASHIVSCALINCSWEDVQRLTSAVLQDEGEVYNLSRREYGSFVVREVRRATKLLELEAMTTGDAQKEYDRQFGLQTDEDMLEESDHATYAGEMERECSALPESQHTNYMERQCTVAEYMD